MTQQMTLAAPSRLFESLPQQPLLLPLRGLPLNRALGCCGCCPCYWRPAGQLLVGRHGSRLYCCCLYCCDGTVGGRWCLRPLLVLPAHDSKQASIITASVSVRWHLAAQPNLHLTAAADDGYMTGLSAAAILLADHNQHMHARRVISVDSCAFVYLSGGPPSVCGTCCT